MQLAAGMCNVLGIKFIIIGCEVGNLLGRLDGWDVGVD
jgi:hypothetical protein